MKKWVSLFLALSLALVLAACGTSSKDSSNKGLTKLVVGASNVPHAVILKEAKPLLKKQGIDLEIKEFTDYVLPNKALASKQLDANYFQHIPYLNAQNKQFGYGFVNAGGIHIEPIGIYSKKYKKLSDLPNGAHLIMSSSVPDHGRLLSLLEAQGLIKLKSGIDKTTATVKDVVDNPKHLVFDTKYEAALLPKIYQNGEGDAVLINSNYAIGAGLNPMKDAIALEDKNSPYVNVIAVRKGDENKPAIKKLVAVLHSKEIQDFIVKKWGGSVVPVK
jgi:D-methionine transport system substrate-binding protein